MLYYRRDLVPAPPRSLEELRDQGLALVRAGRTRYGFVWQGARYEGLVTVFLEHLTAFGGRILDDAGQVRVAEPAAGRALAFMRESVRSGLVPEAALAWQEEPVRFAFQNGDAVFMRNWPYAYPLLADPTRSKVAGRVGVAALPAGAGGEPAATLGGARLAINARSRHPAAALALVRFLTAPEQLLERARMAGQYPARGSLYDDPRLARALSVPVGDVRAIVERAVARPVTPLYAETSAALQVELHAALTAQKAPGAALAAAAARMRTILAQAGPRPGNREGPGPLAWATFTGLLLLTAVAAARVWRRRVRTAVTAPAPARTSRWPGPCWLPPWS